MITIGHLFTQIATKASKSN